MSVKDLATKNSKDTKKAWPLVRLGDVCESFNGLWKGTKQPLKTVGVIRSTNFTKQCEFDHSKIIFIEVEEKKFLKRKLQCGDIVVERSGGGPNQPVGRVLLFDIEEGDYTISNFTSALRIKDKCALDSSYLHRVLVAQYFSGVTAKMQSNATNIINLHYDEFLNIEFPLPPLTVQREIVARLEKELGEADKLAAKFKRVAELADDAFKAELDETFKALEDNSRRDAETRRVRLGDVFDFIDYRGKTPLKTESGVPLITAKNIRQGYLDYHESFYISKKVYATRQTRGIAHKGDILFTTEAPLGFVALADKEEFSTGQRVITFQWKVKGEKACNKYYLYCLLSDWFQGTLRRQATGATAKGIKASRLIDLHVLRVPFSVQEEIVAKLDAAKERCEKLKAAAMRGHAAAENLRKAILAEAFEQ